MPIINVKLVEDVFTPDQKREIIERLTDAMVSIEGENMRPVTWVVVEEVASGDMGVGGKPLSTEDVKALAAGVPAWPSGGESRSRQSQERSPRPIIASLRSAA